MNFDQLNYWICRDNSCINEPCFLCDGDSHEVLYERTDVSLLEGKSFPIPIPKRDFDELSTAKLFRYCDVGNGLIEAHVKYLQDCCSVVFGYLSI